jgi:hypothetical protein
MCLRTSHIPVALSSYNRIAHDYALNRAIKLLLQNFTIQSHDSRCTSTLRLALVSSFQPVPLQPNALPHKPIVLVQPANDLSQVRFIILVDHFMTDEEVDYEKDGPITPFRGVRADLREDFSGADQLWLTGSEAYKSQLLIDTYRNTSAAEVLLGRTRLLHRVAWVDTPRQLSGQTSACSPATQTKISASRRFRARRKIDLLVFYRSCVYAQGRKVARRSISAQGKLTNGCF